jgi:hypothetical protein
MTLELGLAVLVGVAIAFAQTATHWWRCRAPLWMVNDQLARERARRRRP